MALLDATQNYIVLSATVMQTLRIAVCLYHWDLSQNLDEALLEDTFGVLPCKARKVSGL